MSRYMETQKAINGVATQFDRLNAEIDRLEGKVEKIQTAMDWIRSDTAHKAPEQITVELLTSYITMIEEASK